MKKQILLPVLNAIALILTLAVNYLANALPLNGVSTGEISDRFDVFFKPAGYAFSIWGLIYLGLIVFVVYQLSSGRRGAVVLDKIGLLFVVNCLANALWLLVWHYQLLTFSVVVMLVILISLTMIYQNLSIGRSTVTTATKWFVHIPFSLYLGWICVATIANITIHLHWLTWDGFGIPAKTWFVVVCLVGLALSSVFAFSRGDLTVTLVFLWAYVAVAVHNAEVAGVNTMSWIAAGLTVVPVIIALKKSAKAAARTNS